MAETTTIVQIIGGAAVFLTAIGALITSLRTNRRVKKTNEEKKKEAADAVEVIERTAAEQAERVRREADRVQREADEYRQECRTLRVEVDKLSDKVTDTEIELTRKLADQQAKIDAIEFEKKALKERIVELESKIEALQDENRRLKEERENAKIVLQNGGG